MKVPMHGEIYEVGKVTFAGECATALVDGTQVSIVAEHKSDSPALISDFYNTYRRDLVHKYIHTHESDKTRRSRYLENQRFELLVDKVFIRKLEERGIKAFEFTDGEKTEWWITAYGEEVMRVAEGAPQLQVLSTLLEKLNDQRRDMEKRVVDEWFASLGTA